MTDLLLRQETIAPKLVDSEGLTALDLACSKGEIDLFYILLTDHKVLVNEPSEAAFRDKAAKSSQ